MCIFLAYLNGLVCYKTINTFQEVFQLGTYVCLKACRVLKVIVYHYHVITMYGHFFITIFSFPKAYLLLRIKRQKVEKFRLFKSDSTIVGNV